MRTVLAAMLLVVAVGCSRDATESSGEIKGLDPTSATPAAPHHPEIEAVIRNHPDLAEHRLTIKSLDVQGEFALAMAESAREDLDPLTVLLGKKDGSWRVLDYGTALGGVAEDFGVPAATAAHWGL